MQTHGQKINFNKITMGTPRTLLLNLALIYLLLNFNSFLLNFKYTFFAIIFCLCIWLEHITREGDLSWKKMFKSPNLIGAIFNLIIFFPFLLILSCTLELETGCLLCIENEAGNKLNGKILSKSVKTYFLIELRAILYWFFICNNNFFWSLFFSWRICFYENFIFEFIRGWNHTLFYDNNFQ